VARKRGWEEPTNGPDWIDVEVMMRALNALHSGKAGLTFLPRGIGSSGGLETGASFMFDVLPGSSIDPCTTVIKNWPCTQHKTLAAHCFALLHELDFAISEMYKNEALWE
jgi:hypothetical protein